MTTMPLASWLDANWRHEAQKRALAGCADYGTVIRAAQKLEARVWEKHEGLKLLMCDDPWLFRQMICDEMDRPLEDLDPQRLVWPKPILGTHTDPSCRALSKDNFYALLGTRTDRPLPLFSTNTACRYEPAWAGDNLLSLFGTRRLWSDHPERDCADLGVGVPMWQASVAEDKLPAVHVGTAWVRDDKRGQGIAADVVRLHRMVAWLRFGGLPLFATVDEKKNHGKGLRTDLGTCIGRVIEKRGDAEASTRVTLYTPESVIADAERVLNATAPPTI